MNLEMGGKDPFIVCADVAGDVGVAAKRRRLGGVPERRPGVHVGRALLRARARSTTTSSTAFVDYTRLAARGRPARRGHRRRADGVGARSAAKVEAQVEAAVAAGRRAGRGRRPRRARARATSSPPPSSPARPPRPTCCARRPSGRWRRSCRWTRSTRRSSWPTRTRFGLGANVYTRDLETAVRCMREIKAGTVWINDPLTDNDAGPFGGFKQSGPRARARPGGPRGLPGDQARAHRDEDRAEGVVVPLRR